VSEPSTFTDESERSQPPLSPSSRGQLRDLRRPRRHRLPRRRRVVRGRHPDLFPARAEHPRPDGGAAHRRSGTTVASWPPSALTTPLPGTAHPPGALLGAQARRRIFPGDTYRMKLHDCAALAEAEVERVTHTVAGAYRCGYELRPLRGEASTRDPSGSAPPIPGLTVGMSSEGWSRRRSPGVRGAGVIGRATTAGAWQRGGP